MAPAPIRKGESNAARQKRLQAAVKIGPGQTVHFTPGRGYYAGPKLVKPGDPPAKAAPLTIEQQADKMATGSLAYERAEIERQAGIAAQKAKADQAALQGLAVTTADMQRGIGPGIQGAYQGAAGELASLAQGFSSGVAARMTEGQEAAEAFAASQGGGNMQIGPDAGAQKDVAYGLQGYIPGADLTRQGAAQNAWGQALPAITAAALRGDFTKALYEARAEQDKYAEQLITVAAKFPAERDRALQELQKYELDKANLKLDQRQAAVQERAQKLYERQFGEKAADNRVDNALRARTLDLGDAKLELDTAKAVAAAKIAIAKGRQVDAAGSKVWKFIVDKQGNFILDAKGRKIPVKGNASGGGGTAAERNPYPAAVKEASTLIGKPLESPEGLVPKKGKYVTARGVKGGFKDGSTNDPKRAQLGGGKTFLEALAFIQGRYPSLTKAQARKALIAAGYKADGERPPAATGR